MQNALLDRYILLADEAHDEGMIKAIQKTHKHFIKRRRQLFLKHSDAGTVDSERFQRDLTDLDREISEYIGITEQMIVDSLDEVKRLRYAKRSTSSQRIHKFLCANHAYVPIIHDFKLTQAELAILTVMVMQSWPNNRLQGARGFFVKILGLNKDTVKKRLKNLTELGIINKFSKRVDRAMNAPNVITLLHKALIAKAELYRSRVSENFLPNRGGIDTPEPSVIYSVTTGNLLPPNSETKPSGHKSNHECRQKGLRRRQAAKIARSTQTDGLKSYEFCDMVRDGLDYLGLERPDSADENILIGELESLFERKYKSFKPDTLDFLKMKYSHKHILACVLANVMTAYTRKCEISDARPKNEREPIRNPSGYLFQTITAEKSRPISTIASMLEARKTYILPRRLQEIAKERARERECMAA